MIRKLLRFNWLSFGAMIALVVIGTLTIKSAGGARDVFFHDKWIDNLQTAVFGLAIYAVLAFVDYRRYLSWLSLPAYVGAVLLLVLVLLVGSSQMGGKRWLWFFQPSEISKLFVILCLAQLFGAEGELFRGQYGFRGFLAAGGLIAVPCLLILLEPDLGTTLTLVPALLVMLLVAGVWRKGLVVLLAAGAVAATAVLGAVYEAERPGTSPERRAAILRYVPLREHQVSRVKTFLFPERDGLDSGYNLRQATMTIGSGGLVGKGYGKGEAIRRELMPAMGVMNDFIFCVWAEEMGYLKGSLALLALYGLLCVSTAWTALVAGDGRGRLLAFGIATLVFAHVYVNIGMSIGLVPITGLPLPFLSLGRTFLVTVMCGLGLVQSVSLHREEKE